jgi:hypothetical protein
MEYIGTAIFFGICAFFAWLKAQEEQEEYLLAFFVLAFLSLMAFLYPLL